VGGGPYELNDHGDDISMAGRVRRNKQGVVGALPGGLVLLRYQKGGLGLIGGMKSRNL
jgi:hypothetical protein